MREINVHRAEQVLRGLFPSAQIRIDEHANALVVYANQEQVEAMRTVVQGLDVKNPLERTNEVVPLHVKTAQQLASQVQPLYPNAHVAASSKTSLLVRASPQDLAQIKALIGNLDVLSATPTPSPVPVSSLRVLVASPRSVALAVEHSYPRVRANITGSTIVLSGPSDALDGAQKLVQSLDQPGASVRYTQIYRIKNVDARSLADLIQRSFPSAKVTLDQELNALSILATPSEHQRIAAGIQQLDEGSGSSGAPGSGSGGSPAYGDGNIAVVQLDSAMPGLNGSPSTSATDIATAVQQSLTSLASDLRIAVPANTNEIILTGSPQSIRLAKDLIARLDAPLPLVVLDTEVLEMDESAARNLGISAPGAFISSAFTETQPTPNPFGQQGRLIGLQPLTRSPIQFSVTLNTLITKGNARVLADPRITTVSGRTATIHAGDQINILTQTAGSIGTPVTQQLQTFNTGVSLDITPLVGPSGKITVSLHPVVNSLTGFSSQGGIPQISTRDTQTVVQLRDNQTLVIGGLIQEESQHTVSKIPIIGEIPIVGKLFNSSNNNYTRNELVIVVTPHILHAGETPPAPNATVELPTPRSLPTVPPEAAFPMMTPVPQLTATAAPIIVASPNPRRTPIQLDVGPVLNTPIPSASPSIQPTPAAFASANVFQFGTPPQNAYAGPLDAPQIFYATLSPTVVKNGSLITASVITTTNIAKVTLGTNVWSTTLHKLSPSTWQTTFTFNASSADQRTINLQLQAARSDGTSAQIQIPVSVLNSP